MEPQGVQAGVIRKGEAQAEGVDRIGAQRRLGPVHLGPQGSDREQDL